MGLTTLKCQNLQIKSCVVVLERLDEKSVFQYLKKYDSDSTQMVDLVNSVVNQSKRKEIYSNEFPTLHKYTKENWKQKLEKSKKTVAKNKLKQIKSKIKPLFCKDDEHWVKINPKESLTPKAEEILDKTKNFSKLCSGNGDGVFSNKVNSEKSLKVKEIRSRINSKTKKSLSKSEENSKVKVEFDEIISKNLNLNSEKNVPSSTYAQNEITDNMEITKPDVFPEKGNSVTVELPTPIDSSNSRNYNEQNFEEEYDIREDNEDDRVTVIFEGSPHREKDLEEFFKVDKWESVYSINKSINDEVSNLTNVENNLAKTIKPEFRNIKSCSEKKVAEKETSNEFVREYYFKKLCALVRHLYELNKLISQLKKEQSKNEELAVHFSKVIKVQKENFIKEVKKNKKTVIESYEKLLAFYGNSMARLISEISQRAVLRAEDVNSILSWCFLVNESFDVKKSNNLYPQKKENQNISLQAKTSGSSRKIINENLLKLLAAKKLFKSNQLAPESKRFSCQDELIQRPTEVLASPCMLPVKNNVVNHIQASSNRGIISALPPCVNCHKRKQNTSCASTQQKNQVRIMGSCVRHPSQENLNLEHPGEASWYSDPLICRKQPTNVNMHDCSLQNNLPQSSNYSTNPLLNHPRQNIYVESLASEDPSHPLCVQHFYFPNNVRDKPDSHQFSQIDYASPPAQNNSCAAFRSNFQSDRFPCTSNVHKKAIDIHKSLLTSFEEARNPVRNYLHDSTGLSIQKSQEMSAKGEVILGKQCGSEINPRIQFKNIATSVNHEVMDPTRPQKLTMKNCRLQAEPIIDTNVLEAVEKVNSRQSFREEMQDCSRSGEIMSTKCMRNLKASHLYELPERYIL